MQIKMTSACALRLLALGSMGLLSGCFSSGNSLHASQTNGSTGTVTGTIMGGLNPITDSEVSVYETATNGPVLLAKTTSSANGTFELNYPLPPLGSYVYLVAQTGSTGNAGNNLNINLVSVLGEGPTIATEATVNELTTVAAYQAFSQDWTATAPHPTLNLSQETAAAAASQFATFQGIADIATGSFNTYSINTMTGGQLAAQANVLALCVQNTAECGTLQGANYLDTSAQDSFSLMAGLRQAGSTAMTNINTLLSANSSSLPYPEIVLAQSVLGVNFTSTFNMPAGAAVDNAGNIWFTNTGSDNGSGLRGSVTELKKNSDGSTSTVIFSSPSYGFNAPSGLATDGSGNVWVINQGNDTVTEIKNNNDAEGSYSPVIFSAQQGYGFYSSKGIAVDLFGNVWVTNPLGTNSPDRVIEIKKGVNGNYSPVVFDANGPGQGYAFDGPNGIASDSIGNIWVTNKVNNSVVEIKIGVNGNYSPVVFDANGPGQGYTFNTPIAVAADSIGNIWVANINMSGPSITEIKKDNNTYVPDNFTGPGIVAPFALATDSNRNVWAVNDTTPGSVVKLINSC